jgi:hypothetical protein
LNPVTNVVGVLQNCLLRKIIGSKRDVTGGWGKLDHDELHDLYSSPNIIRVFRSRRMRWAGHVARLGDNRNEFRVLVGKPQQIIPLGRLGAGKGKAVPVHGMKAYSGSRGIAPLIIKLSNR